MPFYAVPFPGVRCSTAVRCRAVLCRAVLCRAVPCCAVVSSCHASYQRSHLGLAWRIINSAPLSRAYNSASSAAQRRAMQRGAVPCRAMPCGAVLLCGAVPFCMIFAVLLIFFMPTIIRIVVPPVTSLQTLEKQIRIHTYVYI